jgi:uncharacterized RDD family membrane protein YckC
MSTPPVRNPGKEPESQQRRGTQVNWYYVQKGRQAGPVAEEGLIALVKEGVVRLDTPVWREGMEQWTLLGEVSGTDPAIHEMIQAALAGALGAGGQGAEHLTDPNLRGQASSETVHVLAGPGESYCAECRRVFPTDDMIAFGEQWVCADCKPLFFQRIREGVVPAAPLMWGGFWIRLVARFVDGIILQGLWYVAGYFVGLVFKGRLADDPFQAIRAMLVVYLVGMMVNLAYEVFFLGRFGATPGKMVCGLRVVRPTGEKITYLRAFGRFFACQLSGLILCIGYIMAAFDSQKRALHDHICDTRVVRK